MTVPSRGSVYRAHLRSSATVAVQLVAVAAALWVLAWVVGKTWVIVLPVVLAVIDEKSLEIAILDRTRTGRTFRRIVGEEARALLRD